MDEKRYCVQCKKETAKDTQQCECGCRTFAFGNVKINEESKLTCICGNEMFRQVCHVDFTNKATTDYQCAACNGVITTEYYRNAEERMYWGD
jgi:hypothetical protein